MVSDEEMMAFVDGELDEIARRRIERAIAGDLGLAATVEAQRRLKARLAGHYGPVADEEVPEHFRAMLESNVVLVSGAGRRRLISAPNLAAIAATFVVGVLAAQLIPEASGPLVIEGGRMVAQGALAEALETQLASAQAADAPTRIGITFAAGDGRLCRSFETAAMAGLACRESGGWEVVMTAASARPGSEYRQAGSGAALVMAAAQEMMVGDPLDAEGERAARDARWRARD
jgi:hypothetical protein